MIGVLINAAAVLAGGGIGLLLKKGIPEKVTKAVMTALGLCVLYIGIDGALEGENAIILIVSLALGTFTGTLLDIDGKLNRFSVFVEKKLRGGKNGQGNIAEGFMTGSLLFCVGALAIVGPFNAGLTGDNTLLYTKSILDFVSSCMLAGTLGVGVLLAFTVIIVYQGAFVLLAELLQNVLTDESLIAEITCCGSVMIIGLGLNMLGLTKLKVADFLPALLFVPPVFWLVGLLPL